MSRRAITAITVLVLGALALGHGAIWVFGGLSGALLSQLAFMPGVGMVGAIIANTSGTGGGVVFIPVFNILRHMDVLDLTRDQIVAASFLIQCHGMTMGALTWTRALYRDPSRPQTGIPPGQFWGLIGGVLVIALPVMLATQRLTEFDARSVLFWFKGFSIALGLALIVTTWTVNTDRVERDRLARIDLFVLAGLAVLGGFVTALFSVGIGEFVALYLFIRHYPLNTCTASAVIISAISVLAGAPYLIARDLVPWEVVALAAPGALVGGFLARRIAHWLGAKRLKTLDGGWIVLSSLYLIYLNA
jgi:uncharacterized membrane protein YfcA